MTLRNVRVQWPDNLPAKYVPLILRGALFVVGETAVAGNKSVNTALAPGAILLTGEEIEVAADVPRVVPTKLICAELTVTLLWFTTVTVATRWPFPSLVSGC